MTHFGPPTMEPPPPGAPQQPAGRPKWIKPALAIVAAAAIFGLGILVGSGALSTGDFEFDTTTAAEGGTAVAGPTILEAAVDECNLIGADRGIGDDGYSVDLDSSGNDGGGIAYAKLDCVLNELGISDAIRSRMGGTRALDGTLTAEQGPMTLSWTYHPDAGLDVVISLDQP